MVLKPGLEGVPVTNSGICEINGTEGSLSYRGYPISELAQKSSFLETAFLLIWGELPTEIELEKFEYFPGGASLTASNLNKLGCNVDIFTQIGDDKNGKILNDLLKKIKRLTFGVKTYLLFQILIIQIT